MTKNEFIEKAKLKHGETYDYSKVEYIGSSTKVCIICKTHGEFWQVASCHLSENGCPKCAGKTKSTTEEFIKKAKNVHGNKYDYSKVNYINSRIKIKIICPEHGEFEQIPNSHLSGHNCPKCVGGVNLNTESFIEKSKIIHDEKYNYNEVNYINCFNKVKIICPIHGIFIQNPHTHLCGSGCPKCAGKYMDLSYFIQKSNKKHHNKYDYSNVEYNGCETKVYIICPIHGEFWQRPDVHLSGCGCPICSESNGEKMIANILSTYNIKFEREYKFDDCKNKRKLPFDFYLSEYNTCIEYDGRQHFEVVNAFGGITEFNETKNRDKIKTKYCIDKGINLIRIPYTELKNIEEILKNLIK